MAKNKKGTGVIFSALFAAIISVSCFIQIPLPGGIPVVVQDMFAMLSGMLLGPLYGGIAVFVFLILGCLGLPVFSGKAGLHVLIAGPTCGFLWGYLISTIIAGILLKVFLSQDKLASSAKAYIVLSIVGLVESAVFFACGILGFMIVTESTLEHTLLAILIPFIPGNIIKLVLMVPLAKKFRPIIARYL